MIRDWPGDSYHTSMSVFSTAVNRSSTRLAPASTPRVVAPSRIRIRSMLLSIDSDWFFPTLYFERTPFSAIQSMVS